MQIAGDRIVLVCRLLYGNQPNRVCILIRVQRLVNERLGGVQQRYCLLG